MFDVRPRKAEDSRRSEFPSTIVGKKNIHVPNVTSENERQRPLRLSKDRTQKDRVPAMSGETKDAKQKRTREILQKGRRISLGDRKWNSTMSNETIYRCTL